VFAKRLRLTQLGGEECHATIGRWYFMQTSTGKVIPHQLYDVILFTQMTFMNDKINTFTSISIRKSSKGGNLVAGGDLLEVYNGLGLFPHPES
jgi:hypothetical protein